MNERIKQLAEQAGYPDYMTYGQDKVLERFSELLVHECASIVENLSPGYDDYRNQIEDAFRRDAISEMKYILLGEEK